MLIDAHAHLTDPSILVDIEAILQRAKAAGVETIINICTTPDEVEKGFELSKKFPWVYTVGSTTPHAVEKEGEIFFSKMAAYAKSGALVAVGETGLDYHHFPQSKEIQKKFLSRYLHLAQECKLPVVIHCREAFSDLFAMIDAEYQGRGVLHCFTGTVDEAAMVIERGWYLSLSGIVTFKKSHELHQVAKNVPLDRLIIETDAPYLAPIPHRGQRNEPSFLLETAQFIAHLRGIPLAALAAATASNTRALFAI